MIKKFADKANEFLPDLIKQTVYPKNFVTVFDDENEYFGCRAEKCREKDAFENGETFTLDFGGHITGYFSFTLGYKDRYIDAPVELKIKFAENLFELNSDFSAYEGMLCKSWLQEETIFIDAPITVKMPRRYAFRFVRITVSATPKTVVLKDFCALSVTSADEKNVIPLDAGVDTVLKKIDRVAACTLKWCMQTVYEDGPKRDRRLWLGDFRLQALTDYYLYKNTVLTKRCFYLFASGFDNSIFLSGCIFTNGYVVHDKCCLVDYSLLFGAALCDCYEHTNDKNLSAELFFVAEKQLELAENLLDENGIIVPEKGQGIFIDWCEGLNKISALHGVFMYCTAKVMKLADYLGAGEKFQKYKCLYDKLKKSAISCLYDEKRGVFANKYDDFQLSAAGNIWLILGGAADGAAAKNILRKCLSDEKFLKPVSPYMHHYAAEAMCKLNMLDDAKKYIKNYWGSMINDGADTFWEVYKKGDKYLSPYGNAVINSFCHAWSCTPAYFIRKYFNK